MNSDEITFESLIENKSEKKLYLMYRLKDDNGNFLFVSSSDVLTADFNGIKQKIKMIIPAFFFNEGTFFIDAQVSNGKEILFRYEDALIFNVIHEKKNLGEWMGKTVGPLKPKFEWSVEKIEQE